MFFRLTNSPAIFQIMINKILQNLINTKKMISFINNVIMETEKKERYDKVVDKVVNISSDRTGGN